MSLTNLEPPANPAGTEAITLASVLGALLRDLGAAQDAANRHARRLASGLPGGEAFPSAQLAEVEIDFRFAVDGTGSRTIDVGPVTLPAAMLRTHSLVFARAAVRFSAESLRKRADAAQTVDNLTSRDFEEHLAAALADALGTPGVSLTDINTVIGMLCATVDREVLDDQTVRRLLPSGTDALESLREALAAEAHRAADRIAQDVRGLQAAVTEPEVLVIVDSERLSHVAPELLARVHVRARVDNDRWTATLGGS
jgi:hypothetical protein